MSKFSGLAMSSAAISYSGIDYRWKAARHLVGLTHIRFKDLRAQPAHYGEEAGIPLSIIQGAMGHEDEKMTRRYQRRQVSFDHQHAEAMAAAMGL